MNKQMGAVTENDRISIDQIIQDFRRNNTCDQYTFSPELNNTMRSYIHKQCYKFGLKSKSYGKAPNRILIIFKKKNEAVLNSIDVGLSRTTAQLLMNFNYHPPKFNLNNNKRLKVDNNWDECKRLLRRGLIKVEKPMGNPYGNFRKNLPIFSKREEILDAIKNNKIVIISAETGSGKTTQIPQYILEEAYEQKKEVKVICTQPRRLSTVSVAARVAAERGECLGHVVGYQIKLESRLSHLSSLIYCTNGILLRGFLNDEEGLKNVSHVIIDEIHERDKTTDFLLISIKEELKKYSHLRVLIMSATMDLDIFLKYFDNPMVINVDGRSFDIQSIFLDDILGMIQYENAKMNEIRMSRLKDTAQQPLVTKEIDSFLLQCIQNGSDDNYLHLLQLILNENISPNYQESQTKLSPLMIAAAHGNVDILEKLLNMGADMSLTCNKRLTAFGWAQRSGKEDVLYVLSTYEKQSILNDYDQTISEECIDFNLVVTILEYIHKQFSRAGAILVFLPGYEDIMTCVDRLRNSKEFNFREYKTFILHGSMETNQQSRVFDKMPLGVQKIIFSTNIAETSITINDVRYVVDTGKVKMKSYDAYSGISSLSTQWISMASAMQRAGRAGRTHSGICFHLYSLNRYNSLSVNTVPEILRVPLHELCLYTKIIAPRNMTIQQFLNLAIEPPMPEAINTATNVLKNIGAMDSDENITQLGQHLVQLSIEPHLGKMLIYAAIFKCLDPVLTIAASLSHKDPFFLPTNPSLRTKSLTKRHELSEGTYSDHITLLRAYQRWSAAERNNMKEQFCDEYFVSASTMKLITLTRNQLLVQLRAKGFCTDYLMKELNTHSNNIPLIKACICAGFYPNVAFYDKNKLCTQNERNILINNNSCLKKSELQFNTEDLKRNRFFVYNELSKMHTKCSIRSATVVSALTLGLFCGLNVEENDGVVIIDNWLMLDYHNPEVLKFRAFLDEIVAKKIEDPFVRLHSSEISAINCLSCILQEEDFAMNVIKISGNFKLENQSDAF